jgi:tetratricopeptide (TPR) repeat protein
MKRALWFMTICAAEWACPLYLAAQNENEVEAMRHFQAAHQAQDRGALDLAAQEYQAVIRLEPNVAEGYASLGMVYYAQAKFQDSIRALEQAEKLKPELPGVCLYLGMAYEKLNQPSQAVPYLKKAVHQEPDSKQAQLWLGKALWDAGEPAAALGQLRQADKAFPSDPDVLFSLGEAYRKASDHVIQQVLKDAAGTPLLHQIYGDIYCREHAWGKASGHYQRALELDQHWVGAHLGLAEVFLQQGKLDNAELELHRELQLDSHSASAQARLAEIALLKDKPQDALALLSSALQAGPDATAHALGLPATFITSGELLNKELQQRLREVLPAIENTPAKPARSLALAFIYAQLHDEKSQIAWKDMQAVWPAGLPNSNLYEQAVASFDHQDLNAAESGLHAWLQLHPGDLKARYLLSKTYRDLSLVTLAKMLETASDSYRTHQLLAQTYQNEGQDDKALIEYRVVEQMAPDLPGIHFSIGNLLWSRGDSDHAIAELKTELHENSGHAEANAELGEILVGQHKPDEAIEYLETALRIEPDLSIAHQQLGEAYYQKNNLEKAEAELEKAAENDPEGEVHYQLGLVYRALGRAQAAKEAFAVSQKIKADRVAEGRYEENHQAGAAK